MKITDLKREKLKSLGWKILIAVASLIVGCNTDELSNALDTISSLL